MLELLTYIMIILSTDKNIDRYHNMSYYLNGMLKENYVVNGDITVHQDVLKRDSITISNSNKYSQLSNNYVLQAPIVSISTHG
ncbi:MAG: hypothetical protein IPL25_13000 [Saprospiraceae bacterium]|nr:hypothetical protein [Candidatus Vicinibacter affinis]